MEDGRIGSPIYDHEFMQHVSSFFRLDTVFASLLCLFSFYSSISFISFIASYSSHSPPSSPAPYSPPLIVLFSPFYRYSPFPLHHLLLPLYSLYHRLVMWWRFLDVRTVSSKARPITYGPPPLEASLRCFPFSFSSLRFHSPPYVLFFSFLSPRPLQMPSSKSTFPFLLLISLSLRWRMDSGFIGVQIE